MENFLKIIFNLPKRLLLLIIGLYQVLLSPDHSWLKSAYPYGYCKHYPSCSEYSKLAINNFGFIKGSLLSLKRVVKCNPFVEPSIDLIPNP